MSMTRNEYNRRPNRKSLSSKLGKVARQIKVRDQFSCQYCGRTAEESGSHLHLDHLVPRSEGGADVASNLVLACRRCNCARKTLSLVAFAAYASENFGLSFTAEQIIAQAALPLPSL